MEKRKICLFTALSPSFGGSGVILQSLVKHLDNVQVQWCYISDKAETGYEQGYLGKTQMGGKLLQDIVLTWKLFSNRPNNYINQLVEKLRQVQCDEYWILSHHEGLRLAVELTRQQGRPIHMTIHDDWAGALCARSLRYRFMGVAARKWTIKALKAVSSFDVISHGMKDYYYGLSGLTGAICHRYLLKEELKTVNLLDDSSVLTAGHIGSIYDKDDLIRFLYMFKKYAGFQGKKALMQIWGCHLIPDDFPADLRDCIHIYETLPEKKVVPKLAKCNFVYAMYPFKSSLDVFSKTSLPTKLSSYLQCGRPVFGQGPVDCSLNEYLGSSGIGRLWSNQNENDGFDVLKAVLSLNLSPQQLEHTRCLYFGEANLQIMHHCLSGQK